MRTLIAWLLLTMTVGSWIADTASAQTNPPAATKKANPMPRPPAPPDPAVVKAQQAQQAADLKAFQAMDPILADWEIQSKKISSLYVEIDKIKKSVAWGTEYFKGSALLKSPDLACLEFRKVKIDAAGKPRYKLDDSKKRVLDLEEEPNERMVCTGLDVLQFIYPSKTIFVYPLDKQSRLKALQEGPLPFLFNMKAVEARRRYGMTLLDTTNEFYLIGIAPREQIDKQSFETAYLWLGKKDFLPSKLQLVKLEKEIEEYRFTTIVPNKIIDDIFFHPTKPDKWTVKVNPKEGDDEAPVAKPVPKRATQQPAMRPGPTPR